MRLIFSGLERAIKIEPGFAAVLQIENQALFSRIVLSLMKGNNEDSLEPYTLWDRDEKVCFQNQSIFISDPLNLPWDNKSLIGEVIKKMERELLEDEIIRTEIESTERLLMTNLMKLGVGLQSQYEFSLEWDFKRYLKMLGFGIGIQIDRPYLDNLISFVSLALDAGCNKILTFVNLKTFLTKSELERFYEYIFFSKIRVLLLENKVDESYYKYEQKNTVDQHFPEL